MKRILTILALAAAMLVPTTDFTAQAKKAKSHRKTTRKESVHKKATKTHAEYLRDKLVKRLSKHETLVSDNYVYVTLPYTNRLWSFSPEEIVDAFLTDYVPTMKERHDFLDSDIVVKIFIPNPEIRQGLSVTIEHDGWLGPKYGIYDYYYYDFVDDDIQGQVVETVRQTQIEIVDDDYDPDYRIQEVKREVIHYEPEPAPKEPEPAPKKVEKRDEPQYIFKAVEQMPQFPGGQGALMSWISKNIRYPQIAQENDIEGRVIVEFVVEKDGSIGQAKVVKSVDPELDNEAIRVVKNMPKWQPGKNGGHAVPCWYTLPVTFKLQREAPTE